MRAPLEVHAAQIVVSASGALAKILARDVTDSRQRATVPLVVELLIRGLIDPQHLAVNVCLRVSRVHVANHAPDRVAGLLADGVVLLAVDFQEKDRIGLVFLGSVPQVPDPAPAVAARWIRGTQTSALLILETPDAVQIHGFLHLCHLVQHQKVNAALFQSVGLVAGHVANHAASHIPIFHVGTTMDVPHALKREVKRLLALALSALSKGSVCNPDLRRLPVEVRKLDQRSVRSGHQKDCLTASPIAEHVEVPDIRKPPLLALLHPPDKPLRDLDLRQL